jgi:two-component system, NtrC family, sensor histidine kinase HydH
LPSSGEIPADRERGLSDGYKMTDMDKGKRYKSFHWPALTIVGTVVILLIVIGVSTFKNISREQERTERSLLRHGLTVLRVIEAGLASEDPGGQPGPERIERLIGEVAREPGVDRIALFDGRGNIIAAQPPAHTGNRIQDAEALVFLSGEKGFVTRYWVNPHGERNFEIIKPLFSSSRPDPISRAWGGKKTESRTEPPPGWAADKLFSLSLRLGAFEQARKDDIHHAFLMGGILVLLGGGALYFIFIVQNYYLVDRSLARMKTYTENVVESMADGLISIDEQGRIVTLNRRAGELLLAKEEDIKGKEISQIAGRSFHDLSTESGEIIRGREVEVEDPSGRVIPLSLSAAPVKDETGRGMGSVLLLRDLREIRDLQEKVRRSEHLASLGRLAAGVAHEIRNPLSSIRGFAQYFGNRLKGRPEEENYAAIMVKEVDRLNRVVTELLDFARPREPQRQRISVEEILDHSLALLESELTGKEVRIKREFQAGIPPASADRDQISQAFLNLLLNSLESMAGGGEIRISVKETPDRSALEIVIADTGRGIPPGDREKIFEPFFSTKRKGTGLGLAIVHQIIENHGGAIAVESREGSGTAFRITLPATPDPAGARRDLAPREVPGPKISEVQT